MPITILYREELKEYDFGPGHPFRGDRYQIFPQFLRENLPDDNYCLREGEWATDENLLLICQKDYIDFTRVYYRAANRGLSYDTRFFQYHSPDNRPIGKPGKLEEAARLIVGQAKMAADLVQGARASNRKVVSIGGGMHHAKPNYGEGFCIYNDVAFAAKYLIKKYGLERILILDTDAHAGNGTSEYFYSDSKVLFIDLHQNPKTLYPGTGFINQIGEGDGTGYTINVPLPIYAGYDSYHLVFEEIVLPVTEEFSPQVIIRNGGSDPHFADELTSLGLPVDGFKMIGEKVSQLSEKTCDGKVIDLIGSGYNKQVLPYGWLALISGLANMKISIEEPAPIAQRLPPDQSLNKTEKMVKEVKRTLKDHWQCFR